jgi:hypothetical protein
MKSSLSLLIVAVCLLSFSCSESDEPTIQELIPSLDEMSSVWISSDTIANLPSLRNFRGQAMVNRDLTSVSWIASAPYSGGYHTGVMKVNGQIPKAEQYQWSVYGSKRKGSMEDLEIVSDTRMMFDDNGILWNVKFTNQSDEAMTLEIEQDVIGFISKYDIDWQWWYPLPSIRGNEPVLFIDSLLQRFIQNWDELKLVRDNIGEASPEKDWPSDQTILNSDLYQTTLMDRLVLIDDQNTTAKTAYTFTQTPLSVSKGKCGATIRWQIEIPGNSSETLSFAMAFGEDPTVVTGKASNWAINFDSVFRGIKNSWEEHWI